MLMIILFIFIDVTDDAYPSQENLFMQADEALLDAKTSGKDTLAVVLSLFVSVKDRVIIMAANTLLIDYNDGLERFGGEKERYEKCLLKFVNDSCYSDLLNSMKRGNYSDAFKYANTLKVSVCNLSLMRFYHQLIPFVELLRNEIDVKTAHNVMYSLTETYDRTIFAIRKQLDTKK